MARGELPPDPILKGKIPWEWIEHPEHGRIVRLWSRTFGTWSMQRPWTGTLHQALDAGLGTAAIVDRLIEAGHANGDRERALRRVRLYLFTLRDEGYIDMPFGTPPTRFHDRYHVVKELGRGGVGVAWLCTDPDGKQVVIKHAWDYFQPLAQMDALVRREAKTLAALDHPGILRLYTTFEEGKLVHLVREYADGDGLLAVMAERPLPLGPIVTHLCSLLEHLHGRGYLLLDLRPANFFLRTSDAQPVLIDVGVCHPWTGGTVRLKRSLGSPGFSAPETRLRHSASKASDVFGLGRLLFTLVAKRPPLPDWGPAEMLRHLGTASYRDVLAAMCSEAADDRPSLDAVRAAFAAAGPVASGPIAPPNDA